MALKFDVNVKLTQTKIKLCYYNYLYYKEQTESSPKDFKCKSNQIKNKDGGLMIKNVN